MNQPKDNSTCPASLILRSAELLQRVDLTPEEELRTLESITATASARIEKITGEKKSDAFTESSRTVKISGFINRPSYKSVLGVIRTGNISKIKFDTRLADNQVSYSVRVTFVQKAAARLLIQQHLATPVQIDGDPVQIFYSTDDASGEQLDKETVWKIRHPDITRILRLTIPMPPSTGLPPILYSQGPNSLLGLETNACYFDDLELRHICSKREMDHLLRLCLPEQLGNEVLTISRHVNGWKGPMELIVEFTSIEACVRAWESLVADEKWKGVTYGFEEDPCGGLAENEEINREETDLDEDEEKSDKTVYPSDSASAT